MGISADFANQPVLELSALEELRALDEPGAPTSIVDELISLFVGRLPEQLKLLTAAVNAKDLSTAQKIAHSLKSSSASLGARRFSSICAALEAMTTADQGATLLVQLNAEIDATRGALEQHKNGPI